MLEKKNVQVGLNEEDDTVKEHALFGWELIDTQQIQTGATTKTKGKAKSKPYLNLIGQVKVKTKSTAESQTTFQYEVRLTFQRDDKMPHFAEIKELERKYYSLQDIPNPKGLLILTIVGFVFYVLPGIVLYFLVYKPAKEKVVAQNNEINKQRLDLLTKVTTLAS